MVLREDLADIQSLSGWTAKLQRNEFQNFLNVKKL
jgi:hypothetical protein